MSLNNENTELDKFINEKCNSINTLDDINLLPLTPQLPNCYMYTVIYSLSNLNKFISFLINQNKGQFSYLFNQQIADTEQQQQQQQELNNQDKRKFLIFWLNECFKYLLNLHKIPEHVNDFNKRYIDNFNIYDLFDCLQKYCPMAEEDASLFLEFLFDNLDEVYKATHGDIIENLFKTRFNVSYKCKKCLNVIKAPDDVSTIWRTSTENINENENLVDSFFKVQSMKPYNCENCKKLNVKDECEAEVITSIGGKLPLCLIIQIGRIQFKDNNLFKSDKYLKFEEKLVIQNVEYSLKSVILHLGDGFTEGHYLVAVKKSVKHRPNDLDVNELWFVLDGDKYECMLDINNDFVHKNAILLFYVQ
jgi:uncharacterized UBP type Zn finger protein